jgi:hypothetical protein
VLPFAQVHLEEAPRPSLRRYLILLLFVAVAASISCAQQSKRLKDLKQINIVIEDLGQEGQDFGLSKEGLNAVTLVALKPDLPNLRVGKLAPCFMCSGHVD